MIAVGESYMANGDFPKAIEVIQKGLTKGAMEPGDTDYAKLRLGIAQLKAGKMRPLAVTTAQRSSFFPELPTLAEAGVPGYEFSTWYGLLVPGATPRAVVAQLNAATVKVLRSPALKQQLVLQGLEPTPSTPAEFDAYLRSEVAKWGKVIKAANIRPD